MARFTDLQQPATSDKPEIPSPLMKTAYNVPCERKGMASQMKSGDGEGSPGDEQPPAKDDDTQCEPSSSGGRLGP
eukprot:2185565-Rhodomonas_salina.1